MERRVTGFHQDVEGHWVAELECGHNQHVRHDPPWESRPWVISPEGRNSRLGMLLNCVKCDRKEPLDQQGAPIDGACFSSSKRPIIEQPKVTKLIFDTSKALVGMCLVKRADALVEPPHGQAWRYEYGIAWEGAWTVASSQVQKASRGAAFVIVFELRSAKIDSLVYPYRHICQLHITQFVNESIRHHALSCIRFSERRVLRPMASLCSLPSSSLRSVC